MALAQDSSAAAPATRRPRARPAVLWQALADAPRLEVCGFLASIDLLRLEMCARQSMGDRALAFKHAADAIHPGVAVDLSSDKQIVAQHARLRSLLPSSMDEALQALQATNPSDDRPAMSDFTFAWAFFHEDSGLRTVVFERLNCVPDAELRPGDPFHRMATYVFEVSADAPGHAAMAPILLESQECERRGRSHEFVDSWDPCAYLYCTRKRDGAVCKVASFDALEASINEFESNDQTRHGSVHFPYGHLFLDVHDAYETANTMVVLSFDKVTGQLAALSFSIFKSEEYEEELQASEFRGLLHAKLEREMTRGLGASGGADAPPT